MGNALIELTPTWGRVVRIWWAYLWRNLIAIVVVMILGGILGAILGFIMGAIGIPLNIIKIVSGFIGGVFGLGASIVPIKMIVGKKFKEFRLIIVANKKEE